MSSPDAGIQEISTRMPHQKFEGHTNSVWGVIHLPGGQRIMTCSTDGSLRVWNLKSGLQIGENWEDGKSSVYTIALSPDGKTVASGSEDGVVRLWDIDTGNVIAKWNGHSGSVWSVCWSRDGQRVLSGSDDGTARVWDMESGETILGPINTAPTAGFPAVYSPDENLIATGGSSDIDIWDAKTVERVSTLKGHSDDVWCLAWTLDGNILISGSDDHLIRTWDTVTWEQISVLRGHTDDVQGLAISPNGRILASASFDGTAQLWNLENGRPICSPLQHEAGVTSASFSADGMLLATGCGDGNDVSACTWDISVIVREAGLDYLLSDSDSLQHKQSGLDAHAARRRKLPPGFLDDTGRRVHTYSAQLPPRSSTHNLHLTAPPPSTHLLLDRFPSLFRSHAAAGGDTAHTRAKIGFPNQTRSLVSRRDQTDIERPPQVEVPYAKGRARNIVTRRKSKKNLPVPNNIMTINVTPLNNGVAQSSIAAQDQPSSSQPQVLPAAAIATFATEAPMAADLTIRRAGCWTRFLLSLCCISVENTVDSH